MKNGKVRIYYAGFQGVVSELVMHPGGVEGARSGERFVLLHPMMDLDEEALFLPKSVHMPAGSLNEMARVYVPDVYSPLRPVDSILEQIQADLEAGQSSGIYFSNPSDQYEID